MTDITANTCIECGADWDDHTVRDFRTHWPAAHPETDAHYEEQPGLADEQPPMADHISVAAGLVPLPPAAQLAGAPSHLPALVFRFAQGLQPIGAVAFVGGEQQLKAVRLLVSQAIDGALAAERRSRRQ